MPTTYVSRKNIKTIKNFLMKFSIFTVEKILCNTLLYYIAWACFRSVIFLYHDTIFIGNNVKLDYQ